MVDRGNEWPCNRAARVGCTLLLGGLLAVAACAPSAEYHRFGGRTMGTDYSLTFAGEGNCTSALSQRVSDELRRVNAQMSTWRPDSEISRVNDALMGRWLPVSKELAEVVSLSQQLARRSGGAFDITVGPLVDLWGFGPVPRQGIPKDAQIALAALRVGHAGLRVRLEPPSLRKEVEGLRLDLSAIAKGQAVDRLADLLDRQGCTDYLIEVGGELRLRGVNPQGEAWRVGIETPGGEGPIAARPLESVRPAHQSGTQARRQATAGISRILRLSDVAVATSGDYRNFRRVGDMTVSHTIDPRTGRPVAHGLASVTVIADTAALADGLATLINVLGPEDGFAFANRTGVAAFALIRENGGVKERYTDAMRDYLEWPAIFARGSHPLPPGPICKQAATPTRRDEDVQETSHGLFKGVAPSNQSAEVHPTSLAEAC